MTKNDKGAVDTLFIIAMLLVLGAGVFIWWRVTSASETVSNSENSSTPIPEPARQGPEEYKVTTAVPEQWKEYKDTESGLSLFHPEDWDVAETTTTDPQQFSNDFSKGAESLAIINVKPIDVVQYIVLGIDIVELETKTVVDQFKANFLSISADEGSIVEKEILFDGNLATSISWKQDGAESTNIFVGANGRTYVIPASLPKDDPRLKEDTDPTEYKTIIDSINISDIEQ